MTTGIGVLGSGLALAAAGMLPRYTVNAETNLAGGDYAALGEAGVLNPPWTLDYLLAQTVGVGSGYHFRAASLGGAVVVLALLALPMARQRFAVPFFAVLTLVAMILTLDTTPLHQLFYLIPRYREFHDHDAWRTMALAAIGPAMLSGAAIESLPRWRGRRDLLPIVFVPLLFMVVVAVVLWQAGRSLGWQPLVAATLTTALIAVAVAIPLRDSRDSDRQRQHPRRDRACHPEARGISSVPSRIDASDEILTFTAARNDTSLGAHASPSVDPGPDPRGRLPVPHRSGAHRIVAGLATAPEMGATLATQPRGGGRARHGRQPHGSRRRRQVPPGAARVLRPIPLRRLRRISGTRATRRAGRATWSAASTRPSARCWSTGAPSISVSTTSRGTTRSISHVMTSSWPPSTARRRTTTPPFCSPPVCARPLLDLLDVRYIVQDAELATRSGRRPGPGRRDAGGLQHAAGDRPRARLGAASRLDRARCATRDPRRGVAPPDQWRGRSLSDRARRGSAARHRRAGRLRGRVGTSHRLRTGQGDDRHASRRSRAARRQRDLRVGVAGVCRRRRGRDPSHRSRAAGYTDSRAASTRSRCNTTRSRCDWDSGSAASRRRRCW